MLLCANAATSLPSPVFVHRGPYCLTINPEAPCAEVMLECRTALLPNNEAMPS